MTTFYGLEMQSGPLLTRAAVMAETLRGLAERYHSPLAYLADAGIPSEAISDLRHYLLED